MKRAPLFAAVILLCAVPVLHAYAAGVVITHSETLQNLAVDRGKLRNLPGSLRQASVSLSFDALGQRFELELDSNHRLAPQFLTRDAQADFGVYRGKLAGRPGSWARITIMNGIPTGLIWDGTEMLAIEATAGGGSASIYRLKDTYVESGAMSCGTSGPEKTLATAYASVAGELEAVISRAPGAVDELKIGLVGDYEFTNLVGAGNVDAEILSRMNLVDGIFSEQLQVQIVVEVIESFTDPNDPFTTTVPGALLVELADYREITPVQNSQGLTHMFTGRNLDGTTAGIAYRDALCSTRFGVGLSEGVRNIVTDSLVAAHEIGHNFGAEHDGEAGSVCASVTGEFLMSPQVSSTDQFSTCSVNTMRPRADAARCINPLPATDVAIGLTNTPSSLLLGVSENLIFDVSNGGTQNGNNVRASFVVPTNLTINSVATTVGSCTSGGGRADCTIGTLAGGASASVALSVTTSTVGSGVLDATVVADGDVNLSDNALAVPIVVNPATDLRIIGVGSRTIALNGAATITPRIENVSSLAATNVTFSMAGSAGLRFDSASWSGGTCSIVTGSVTCQRSNLAAGSNVSLDIQFTATAAGSQSLNASVSSTETDANEFDNNASGTVTVPGGGGGSDSGGGGSAFGLFWMLLASLAGFAGRARRP